MNRGRNTGTMQLSGGVGNATCDWNWRPAQPQGKRVELSGKERRSDLGDRLLSIGTVPGLKSIPIQNSRQPPVVVHRVFIDEFAAVDAATWASSCAERPRHSGAGYGSWPRLIPKCFSDRTGTEPDIILPWFTRSSSYAARRSRTIGQWACPATCSTSLSNRAPGLPATSA